MYQHFNFLYEYFKDFISMLSLKEFYTNYMSFKLNNINKILIKISKHDPKRF